MSPLLFSIAVSWGGTISGTIRGEAGGGIADADVYAINSQLAAARVQSDTAGGYRFEGRPAGWLRVWFCPPRAMSTSAATTRPPLSSVTAHWSAYTRIRR